MHIISEISSISSIITIKILKIDSQQFSIIIHIPEVERQHPSSLLFCPYGVAGRIQPVKVAQYVNIINQSKQIQTQINRVGKSIVFTKVTILRNFHAVKGEALLSTSLCSNPPEGTDTLVTLLNWKILEKTNTKSSFSSQ